MIEFYVVIFESIIAIIFAGLDSYILIHRGKKNKSILDCILGFFFISMVLSGVFMLLSYMFIESSQDLLSFIFWLLGRITPIYGFMILFLFYSYLKSTKLPTITTSFFSFLEGLYTFSIITHPMIFSTSKIPYPWEISIESRVLANLILIIFMIYMIKVSRDILKNNIKPQKIITQILFGITSSIIMSVFIAIDSTLFKILSRMGFSFLAAIAFGAIFEFIILRKSDVISSYFLFNINTLLVLDKGGNILYSYSDSGKEVDLKHGAIINAILHMIPEMLNVDKVDEIITYSNSIIINWGKKTGIITVIVSNKPNFGIFEFIKEITLQIDNELSKYNDNRIIDNEKIQVIKNIIYKVSPALVKN